MHYKEVSDESHLRETVCRRDCQWFGRGGGAYYIQSRLTHSFTHYYEAAQETRLIPVNTRRPK